MGQSESLPAVYNDDSFCSNTSILPHQKEASKRLAKSKRGLLLYHAIGSGKTLTALLSIEKIMKADKNMSKVYLVMPEILIENFNVEKKKHGYSHIKTVSLYDTLPEKLVNSIVIIDEVHIFAYNLFNSKSGREKQLYKLMMRSNNCKFIMMSGTPVYDTPFDLSPMINILAGKEVFPRSGEEFKNLYFNEFKLEPYRYGKLRSIFKEYVSYFGMENSVLFPKIKSVNMLNFTITSGLQDVKEAKDEYFVSTGAFDAIYENLKTHKNEIGNVFIYCGYPEMMDTVEDFFKEKNIGPYIRITPKNIGMLEDYKYILGSSESTVGISIPDCRYAYILSIPDYFGDIQQVSGRIRRICIHQNIPEGKRDITYWILVSDHSGSKIKEKLRTIGIYNKLNTHFQEIMKDAGI